MNIEGVIFTVYGVSFSRRGLYSWRRSWVNIGFKVRYFLRRQINEPVEINGKRILILSSDPFFTQPILFVSERGGADSRSE